MKVSEETKRKISEARLAKKSPGMTGKKHSEETKQKISNTKLGKKQSQETCLKISLALIGNTYGRGNKGKIFSENHRRLLAKAQKGELSYNWKGGITTTHSKIRNSVRYKIWRDKVFRQDNFTCQICGQIGGRLNAHHIKPFYKYPQKRFHVNNGITLCIKCHNLTKGYFERVKEINLEQINLLEVLNNCEYQTL